MGQNLAPEKTKHSKVNMYRPPYGKDLPVSYKVEGPFSDFQKDIDLLFDTFFENYNEYKAEKMPLSSENGYKDFGIPGPSQYKAFSDLFNFFKNEEFELLRHEDYSYYDLTSKKTQLDRGIVEFAENLINFDFDVDNQDKKVILSCGSFWKDQLEIREKMLGIFKHLHTEKGINIQLYMNCTKEEIKGHDEFIEQIKGTSRFGLKKRIPIHFIQAGNDYFYIEFPHAEEIVVRLNLFLDLKKIEYKGGFEKANVEQFFNKLIQQALD
jgi:hypothetical protein